MVFNWEEMTKTQQQQETEKSVSEILEPVKVINEYQLKYEPIINQSNKAIIILGQNKEDLNVITKFFKDKQLAVKSDEFGNFEFIGTNGHDDKIDIFNVPANKNQPNLMVYNSNYLNNNHSFAQSILNIFFLQKILDTKPTKFILVIKDIAIKTDQSTNTQNKVNELANILWEFTNLLETVDIGINNNISVIFTDTINEKRPIQISNIFNEALKEKSFSEKQKSIIAKLASNSYFFPKPSNTPKYGKILKILYDKDYITPNESNKITINDRNSEDILSATEMINLEIKSNMDAIKTEIKKIWNKEKNTIFDPAKNQELARLIKILKDSQTSDSNEKTVENFLKVSDELYSILQISKPENSLESLINYLKYFSNINNFQENSDLINPPSWFDDLFSEVKSYDIDRELLASFITTMTDPKNSFLKKLNETVQNFYNNIKTNKDLGTAEVNNIFKLREFLTKIKTANIKNLEDIKTNLKSNLIDLSLTLSISKNITNLQNLINPINEEDAKLLWEYIKGSITEISKDEEINIVIYDKLLSSQIRPNQGIDTYNKLEELLKNAYDNMSKKHKEERLLTSTYEDNKEDREEQFCKHQLAEIYCQKAQISTMTPEQSIELYQKAAEFGSVKANIKLGNIELGKKNYSEALKYLYSTPNEESVSKAFKNLISTKKSEIISKMHQGSIEDVQKLSLVLTEAYLKQAGYCKDYGMPITKTQELTRKAFLNIIAATITADEYNNNIILHNLYKCLSTLYSSLDNQLKFNKIAAKYKDLELKFNNTGKDEIPYLLSLKDIPTDYDEDFSDILGACNRSTDYSEKTIW